MSNTRKTAGQRLDDEIMDSISDAATGIVDYLTPERKDRSKPAPVDEIEEIKKRRKARLEALKEKYKD